MEGDMKFFSVLKKGGDKKIVKYKKKNPPFSPP